MEKKLIKLLQIMLVLQERPHPDNAGRRFKLTNQERYNPYNPVSYFVILLSVLYSLIYYFIKNVVEFWRKPFKWS
jgi:hypothetical protein